MELSLAPKRASDTSPLNDFHSPVKNNRTAEQWPICIAGTAGVHGYIF
jgi:hypothetical protein